MRSGPRARMVTPEPPVNEVKKAQTSTVTKGGPIRYCPTKLWKTVTSRSEALLSARTKPASVKRGIVGTIASTTREYWLTETIEMGSSSAQKNNRAAPPRVVKMGAPRMVARTMTAIPGSQRLAAEMGAFHVRRRRKRAPPQAARRKGHRFPVFQRIRIAMAAKPAGMIN